MKKLFLLTVAVILGIGTTFAGPVDVNTAKAIGQKFVQANFENTRSVNLELTYTFSSERGDAGFYIFNVNENSFVVVSADDNFRPIVGFSEEGAFDADNISPEFAFYMNAILKGKEQKGNVIDPKVTEEWSSVMDSGRLLSYNNGRGVDFLVKTRWNQNPAPYNSMCPADAGGPGGHVYVGCVATAMSQIMKYWNYPEQGQGSHSYYCSGYGTQTANFGATTYDWANMLNNYPSGSYTTEQGNAVATICYHCGVSVDMMYANDGSGAYSEDVVDAIKNYFLYSTAAVMRQYSNVTTWKNYLKEQHDLGWPVYYAGYSSEGGHAFICDGYNDNDLFHFNWGWGGSSNGWYVVTDIDYNSGMRMITNFVPADVYNNTIQAPSGVTATKTDDLAQEATITWINPTKTLSNQTISSIEQMVVERNGVVIHTVDNVTPGASMSYVDADVPCYSTFEYRVYAMQSGAHGAYGAATESFGPVCGWSVVATAQNMQGWKGGKLCAYDGAGREITSVTMTNNTPANFPINVTIGKVMFAWQAGSEAVTLSFKIKDSTGTIVYEYSGSSDEIPAGYFYSGNNGCGNTAPTEVPSGLVATQNGEDISLTWDGNLKSNYGYNIYRDGYLIKLAHTNQFVDINPGIGGHCYQVCTLGNGGESVLSNEVCANSGDGCDAPTNLRYVLQANGKPIISWDAAANIVDDDGYYVFRKVDDGEYTRIKVVAADKTEYKETKVMEVGHWYYYRVQAYHTVTECLSAPAQAQNAYEFFVKVLFSPEGVDENMSQAVEVYPNPAKDNITVAADNISSVMIYNSIGQKVFAQDYDTEKVVINTSNFESGIYMVRIVANGNEITKKVSIMK